MDFLGLEPSAEQAAQAVASMKKNLRRGLPIDWQERQSLSPKIVDLYTNCFNRTFV